MSDVDVLRPELASDRLRHCPQPEFRARERGISGPPSEARGRSGEEDIPLAARDHQSGCFTACEKTRVTGHLPDLSEYPLRCLENGKIDVSADIEDADFERRLLVSIA